MRIRKALVLPDMQCPYEDKATMKAVEKYMADDTFDYYINLGDFMDFDCISHHNIGKLRNVEGKRILKDYEYANKILDRHQSIIRKNNPKAEFVLLNGNHENRIDRMLEAQPVLSGMIEVDKGLRLKERGFKWVKCYPDGEVYKLGKASFHHGLYVSDGHAKKMVNAFNCNIFYGHLHDVQGYSKVTYGSNKTIVGQSLGCLCEYEQCYIKGNPTKWQQAITVFEFQENGTFTYNIIRIFNHSFSVNGKFYQP